MDSYIKESPIMSYSAKPESSIINSYIKESPIMSYSANPMTDKQSLLPARAGRIN
jgi:hypothetical protein